jgi:integrase
MAGKRKPPRLRFDGRYYVANFYEPNGNNGKRNTISFGAPCERTEGEIYVAFGKWLDLYNQFPHKVCSFESPYDAIGSIIDSSCIVTVEDLVDKFLVHAERNAQGERAVYNTKRIRELLTPYATWPVSNFGPDDLLAVRHKLLNSTYMPKNQNWKKEKQYTRRGVNDLICWIRRIWEWGMGRQIITPAQVQSFKEVKPLRMGEAPDNHRRKRVTEDEFRKVVDNVNGVVGDMLKLMWYTAMRPQEVCSMRPFDILHDNGDCWLYVPGRDQTPVGDHKTTRFGRIRAIPLTQKSQEILAPRIRNFTSKDYIFSPRRAVSEVFKNRNSKRTTPLSCGNKPGTNRKKNPKRRPGEMYMHNALRIACKRACIKGGVDVFTPYDLRRSVATGVRALLGKENARVLLGHANTDTTEIYLLEEVQEAIKVAKMLNSLKYGRQG